MPRKKPPSGPAGDFRTDKQKASDKKLDGSWWRCVKHGLTDGPVFLGDSVYCPDENCTDRVILVHKVMEDKVEAKTWNEGPRRSK